MSLCFIDNTTIDHKTRKRIRSHVMQGRNAGRTLARRSKFPQKYNVQLGERCDLESQHKDNAVTSNAQIVVGGPYSTFLFPAKLSPRNNRVVHQFFSVVLTAEYAHAYRNPFESETISWIQYISEKDSNFPAYLCLMAACNDFHTRQASPSEATLEHVCRAVHKVNQNISTGEALSDATLECVLSLAAYEQLSNDFTAWKIHMDALYRLVQLRGGLERFHHAKHFIRKLCRNDIDLTISYGCPPLFHWVDDVNPQFQPISYSANANRTLPLPLAFVGISEPLQTVAIGIKSLADTIAGSGSKQIDRDAFQDAFIPLCYRLLQLDYSCGLDLTTPRDRAWHLGLTAFMTTLMYQLGGRRMLQLESLADQITIVLCTDLPITGLMSGVVLWLLFISRVAVFGVADEAWLVPKIAAVTTSLGISNWAGVHHRLSQYPWIDELHTKPAKLLWERYGASLNSKTKTCHSLKALSVRPNV